MLHLDIHHAVRQATSRAVNDLMAARYPDLPALHWSHVHGGRIVGTPLDDADPAAAGIVDAWADRLALLPTRPAVAGTDVRVGTVEGLAVEVWRVTESALFADALSWAPTSEDDRT